MSRLHRVCRWGVVGVLVHLAWFALSGVPLWAPISGEAHDAGRMLALIGLHVAAGFYGFLWATGVFE